MALPCGIGWLRFTLGVTETGLDQSIPDFDFEYLGVARNIDSGLSESLL